MLTWYQEHFDTVEIYNGVHRLPSEAALKRWHSSTPGHFRFAVKGSRFLTHMQKLKDPQPGLKKSFSRVELLKGKLGPILFQLPPDFEVNIRRLESFLDALPQWHRHAFEFRNQSWNNPEVLGLLRERNVAYRPFHLAGDQSPIEITASWRVALVKPQLVSGQDHLEKAPLADGHGSALFTILACCSLSSNGNSRSRYALPSSNNLPCLPPRMPPPDVSA